jgi:hypothetical protein
MTGIVSLLALRAAPDPATVLRTQGIPEGHEIPHRVADLVESARSAYEALAEPRGIVREISLPDFLETYEGEGRNAVPSPLPRIVRRAHWLALFAATIGDPVGRRIAELFGTNEPALGSMLDGIASERADAAATYLGRSFLDHLTDTGQAEPDTRVLPYSPGYCGWHITGQHRLFAHLDPGQIGIQLSESCLMSPLKSVSGVLVAGPGEIHDFDNAFEFCLDCATWECRERIASATRPELR